MPWCKISESFDQSGWWLNMRYSNTGDLNSEPYLVVDAESYANAIPRFSNCWRKDQLWAAALSLHWNMKFEFLYSCVG